LVGGEQEAQEQERKRRAQKRLIPTRVLRYHFEMGKIRHGTKKA
jgi:hypothetical protein